ncbi:MAG: hypothetical protein KDA41_11300, partial [Planctomycetales bacterium]|nr:hypothetical protein [Planctomycetales bacterium]
VAVCADCGRVHDAIQFKVVGVPVHSWTREMSTPLQLARNDLGDPCFHAGATPWHVVRLWGLMYPACPNHCGTLTLVGDTDEYVAVQSAKVRRIAADQPDVATQLRQYAIYDRERFWQALDSAIADLEESAATTHPNASTQ